MVSTGASSLSFSAILLITLKSKYCESHVICELTIELIQNRVLLLCTKFLRGCPCPRCVVKKTDNPKMGTLSDMLMCRTGIRTNNKVYQTLIEKACQLVFKHGKKVMSKKVSDLLKEQSLVPIRVSDDSIPLLLLLTSSLTRMHFLSVPRLRMFILIFSSFSLSTYSTSLNSGYGRQYLHI